MLLKRYRQSIIMMVFSLILSLLSVTLFLGENPILVNFLKRLETIPYDLRLKLSTPQSIDDIPPIFIIDLDEKSLKKEGRWPWSRYKLAQLIDKLTQSGVSVIALDMVQSEREVNPIDRVKQAAQKKGYTLPTWLNNLEKTLDADQYFASVIKEKGVILGYFFHKNNSLKIGKLGSTAVQIDKKENLERLTTLTMQGFTNNLTAFRQNADGSGFFNVVPDNDGNIRKAPLVIKFGDQLYPSLALEVARNYLLEERVIVYSERVDDAVITHLSFGDKKIPTDAQGQILIPYRGKAKHFPYLSATDVLQSQHPIPKLETAIVFIGTSAIGLGDLKSTPISPANFPGVEIQANILYSILNPRLIVHEPDWSAGATIALLVFLGVLMLLLYPLLHPITLVITGVSLLLAILMFNIGLWFIFQFYLPLIIPLLLVFTVTGWHIVYYLIVETKERQRIHHMFGQYVPIEHINQLIEKKEQSSMEGERREMSVLFSDIRRFTALSESLSTTELKAFINCYFTPITEIIFAHQGTVDKYVGDMVMAFWGAPIKTDQHAQQAVIAALEMQKTLPLMQDRFRQLGLHDKVAAGIGIHTGYMNVGDMGSIYRRAYTVLGDAVNLGSRLESLTKFYSVKILVSEATKAHCQNIVFRYIDYVQVKGKQTAIKIYEPVGLTNELSSQALTQVDQHNELFKLYLSGNWEQATRGFIQHLNQYQEPLYALYLERLETLSQQNNKNWKGVYQHQTK